MTSYKYKFRRTTLIAVFLTAVLVGLGLARTKIEFQIWWPAVSLLLIIITLRRARVMFVVPIMLLGLCIGWWRGSAYMSLLDNYNNLYKNNVVVAGVADSDAVYGDKSQISFDLGQIKVIAPYRIDLVGKIGVKGFGEPMVYKGDTVQVSAKLYPFRGPRQASLSFASIKVIEKSDSAIEVIRRRFGAGMQSALPEPAASFGLGLLIGQRSTIPKSVSLQLAAVGLTHVVAVSGYNLTIIMRAVRKLLRKRSKYQSTVASLLLIGIFLLFTGFSASIVRAAIVSTLSLWAWYYGRTFRPIVLILLAAVITAGVYPIYLWSDIGWYLSFLAFFGILVLAPLITKRVFKSRQPKILMTLIIETSAAQIMTMPIIMYIFGQFSAVALLANVLVVPLVPIAMSLCLVAGLAGMFVPFMSGWLAMPSRLSLTYMLDVVSLLSRLPRALIQQSITVWQMVLMYCGMVILIIILWHKIKTSSGIITDIKQVVGGEI